MARPHKIFRGWFSRWMESDWSESSRSESLWPESRRHESNRGTRAKVELGVLLLESRIVPTQLYGPLQPDTIEQMTRLALDAYGLTAVLPESPIGAQSYLELSNFTAFSIDTDRLLDHLTASSKQRLALPRPNGGFERFEVWEYQLMSEDLAALRPDMKVYRGIGLDDPTASLAADITPFGFRAQVLTPNGHYYIDPYYHLDTSIFVSYFKSDATHKPGGGCMCLNCTQVLSGGGIAPQGPGGGFELQGPNISNGLNLRRYRLAMAATGEYTQFWGGTVPNAQAGMLTTINRVAGIYERDLAVTFTYINNTSIIYTNPATDPYSNNNGVAMLSQNQTTMDTVIGNANYDIGHVLSTGGGGVATLAVVGVTGQKARGVTGSSTPTGDAFDVDYVAHEMGHQFAANHSFNAPNGNRNASTAYEPGSGSTIMSYAGIIPGNNVQNNSDAYFHAVSIGEIINFLKTIPGVGTITSSGNTPPVANAGSNFTIPANTPFAITGSATDAEGDPITYTWEQYDLGPATTLGTYSSTAPLFRSVQGTSNPTRTFPTLTNLLNNTSSPNEVMPTGARTLNFTLTARDTRALSGLFGPVVGGVGMSDMKVTVASSTGFQVTSPNTAVSWVGGSSQTITWNVAGTNASPINTTQVNILLSTDGGLTFPHTVATNVPNTGSAVVTLPNIPTSKARIRVQPVNNIYFDISNVNFTITAGATMQVTSTAPTAGGVLSGPIATLDLVFSENINAATLQASDLSVSTGTVSGVSLLSANTARFTISGLSSEGPLAASMAAGAIASTAGNPNIAFSGNYNVDLSTVAFSAPFTAVQPLGSRVYRATQTGVSINAPGDTDSFTLAIDAGQTVSAIVEPAAGLAAKITMTGPGVNQNATGVLGKPVALNGVSVNTTGTYTFTVEGLGTDTGSYSLQILLNAVPETESIGGSTNNTIATAQNLNAAFFSLGSSGSMVSVRGDLVGAGLAAEAEPNNTIATASNVATSFTVYSGNLFHMSLAGAMNSTSDTDYFNIGSLDVGDVITISQAGASSNRGTLPDPLVRLYRNTTEIASNDDGGTNLDSLIHQFSIATVGTHYIQAHQYTDFGGATGTYQLGALLANTGSPPSTGGSFASEIEPNDSVATANNASSSWRPVQYISTVSGALSSGTDIDIFAYNFTAGDLITINARSTASAALNTRILNSAGTELALENGSTGPGNNSPIYGFVIPSTGIYYIDVRGNAAGSYELDVLLTSNTPPPVPFDHFSIPLDNGDSLDVAFKAGLAGSYNLELLNSSGVVLATGTGGFSNLDRSIAGFIAPATGNYIVRLSGSTNSDYLLTATRNSAFDREPNDNFATAQAVDGNKPIVGALSGNDDFYSINLTAGNTYTFATLTPADGSGVFNNILDPRLELYSPSNVLVTADSNSAADGRNAVLSVPITASGLYRLRVMPDTGSGEYQVNISSQATSASVSGFVVNGGAPQRSRLTTIQVSFTQPVDAATLAAPGAVVLTRTSSTATGGVPGTIVQTGATGSNGRIIVSPASGSVSSITLTFDNADGSSVSSGVEFGSLADGYWQLAIPSMAFTSSTNNFELRRLFGDNNNDGTVDSLDFGNFGTIFGLSLASPTFNPALDYNADGVIDTNDFANFGNRFGVSL